MGNKVGFEIIYSKISWLSVAKHKTFFFYFFLKNVPASNPLAFKKRSSYMKEESTSEYATDFN